MIVLRLLNLRRNNNNDSHEDSVSPATRTTTTTTTCKGKINNIKKTPFQIDFEIMNNLTENMKNCSVRSSLGILPEDVMLTSDSIRLPSEEGDQFTAYVSNMSFNSHLADKINNANSTSKGVSPFNCDDEVFKAPLPAKNLTSAEVKKNLGSVRSSLGILSEDVMLTPDSFRLPSEEGEQFTNKANNMQPPSIRVSPFHGNDEVFKAPLPATNKTPPMGLPAYLLKPGQKKFDAVSAVHNPVIDEASFMSNRSSFSWDKVMRGYVDQQQQDVEHEDSFCTGQFSARSTSLTGSGVGRTRDERFSDYNPFDLTGAQKAEQFDGEFDQEEFKSMGEGGLDILDKDERLFEEEHRLEMQETPELDSPSKRHGHVIELTSCSMSGESPNLNPLSQSAYFLQNTSRLGTLSGDDSDRPDLGLGFIKSPAKKPKESEPSSSNSTYTVSNSSSSEAETTIVLDNQQMRRISAFRDTDEAQLKQLISQADPNLNAKDFANLISQLVGRKNDDTIAEAEQFLPSFILDSSSSENESQQVPANTSNSTATSNSFNPPAARSQPNSKIPRPANKRLPAVKGQRFSSPIKNDQKAVVVKENVPRRNINIQVTDCSEPQRTPLTDQSNSKSVFTTGVVPKNSTQFNGDSKVKGVLPVTVLKTVMTWLAVDVGRNEEQFLNMQNALDEELVVKLIIRESKEFSFGMSESRTLTLPPKGKVAVPVIYHPARVGGVSKGVLAIKPQTKIVNQQQKRYLKGTIRLQGFGGSPDVQLVSGFGDAASKGRRVLSLSDDRLTWTVELSNEGNLTAFYKLAPFRDSDCRQPFKEDAFIIDPSPFGLLPPNRKTRLTLRFNEKRISLKNGHLASMAVFYGAEVCREVMREARQLPGSARLSESSALLCVDFNHDFAHVRKENGFFEGGKISAFDVQHFYDKTHKEIVDIVGSFPFVKSPVFQTLPAEDTLSETRLNCTVGGQVASPSQFETIDEEAEHNLRESPPVHRHLACQGVKNNGAKKSRTGLYLESDSLSFPKLAAGQSTTVKLRLKNRFSHQCAVSVLIAPKAPFHLKQKHFKLEVSPQSFLAVPVEFRPTKAGMFKDCIKFKCPGNPQIILTATLNGFADENAS